ncbi:serine hydrolase [Candidatus Saccharibacteria bacterium]|nr:serine hydrolase [Candidatus Saccharibacteria bacterium]
MVHQKACKRSAINNKKARLKLFVVAILMLGVSFGASFGILMIVNNNTVDEEKPHEVEGFVQPVTQEPEEELPPVINFQSVIDEWANGISGNKSVLVYDLERNEVVGEYNADENYGTASLYKLFVVYEGYRRIANGEWTTDMAAGVTGKALLECLDLAIRESNSNCAETIWAMIGHDNLDKIIYDDFNISHSDISSLTSNPKDIMEIMKLFFNHPDINDADLITRIKDSFLNQPITEYNWRQGLPSGFSRASVYNKVGWDYNPNKKYWNIYHDAAIVEFPEDNRHYIVVVMTNYVPFQQIRNFGTMIENYYYNNN